MRVFDEKIEYGCELSMSTATQDSDSDIINALSDSPAAYMQSNPTFMRGVFSLNFLGSRGDPGGSRRRKTHFPSVLGQRCFWAYSRRK